MMFMMFHSSERRRPWLIAFFTVLLAIGAALAVGMN